MKDRSIVIGILARDCADPLRENILRVERLGSSFSTYNVVVCENDSKDGTKKILREWAERNDRVIIKSSDTHVETVPHKSESIPFPAWSIHRIGKMASARNYLLDEIRKLFRPDFVCFIDIDLHFFSVEGIINAIKNAPDDWGALLANGQQWCSVNGNREVFPAQYDPYAFLTRGADYRNPSSYTFDPEYDIYKGYMMHRTLCNCDSSYIPCESAFGGVGVYRYECIRDLRYEAYIIPEFKKYSIALCEHVPFNCKISEKGYVNYIARDIVTVRESWSRKTTAAVTGYLRNVLKKYLDADGIAIKGLRHKKYSVITCIFNNYEKVHEIEVKDPDADYILVTDDILLKSDTWNVVYDPELDGMSPFDKTFFVRYHCFRYCDTDICLRIDGSMQVKDSLRQIIDIFEQGGYDAALMPHPFHDNFLEEYDLWCRRRHYPKKQARRCVDDMRDRGYDFNYKGMFQTGFSIQRRGELTDEIDRVTYDYLRELGTGGVIERLDQIPFSFIMNTRFSHIKVLPVSEQILRSYCLQLYEHNSTRMNLNAFYDRMKPDVRYMFNKKVTCLYLDTPPESITRREEELVGVIRELMRKKH